MNRNTVLTEQNFCIIVDTVELIIGKRMKALNEVKALNLYKPTVRNGKSDPFNLERVLGGGPATLKYQRRQGQNPSYYYSPDDLDYSVFSFSQVKNTVESFFDPGAQEKLQAWRDRVGEAEADRICSQSKEAGQIGHKMLENWAQNKALGVCPIKMMPYKKALTNDILPHLHQDNLGVSLTDHNGEILLLSEVFVADFNAQFMGRFDLVTHIITEPFNNKRVLLELKGSLKPKKPEFMHPHIIQAAAYQSTFNKIAAAFPDYLEPLDGVALAYMYSTGYGEFVPVLEEELEEYEQQWLQWLDCFHNLLRGVNAA